MDSEDISKDMFPIHWCWQQLIFEQVEWPNVVMACSSKPCLRLAIQDQRLMN